ncbi:MAG: DMT family transporter [Anaerolineae bacterium]|nr:DMT family transporter [Anaerolineae bacterium]MDH7474978.1 DMT family transporter [Anaerolineae bacterium]
MTSDERRGLWYVVIAVFFFSTSPIFTRWAAPLSPYVITCGRLGTGAIFVYLLAVLQGQRPRWRREDLSRFLLFGLIAALHFLCYIASLSFTTIAHSLALTYTSPVFVTLFTRLFLKEPIASRKYIGVVITIIGMAILAGFEPQLTSRMMIGDVLALGSAVAFGLYSVAGRSQRELYSLFTYASGVYGLAALWTLPLALLTYSPPSSPLRPALSILALGLLPMSLGHTLYNAALRRTHPTYVNLIATQEVTGGVLLGVLFLGEIPSVQSLIGAAVMLIGIALVLI